MAIQKPFPEYPEQVHTHMEDVSGSVSENKAYTQLLVFGITLADDLEKQGNQTGSLVVKMLLEALEGEN